MKKCLIVSTVIFLMLFSGLAQAVSFQKRVIIYYGFIQPIININQGINFYTEGGYSLGSELCQGQKFKIVTDTPSGDWVTPGGWEGDPSIVFVDNLKDVNKQQIPVYEVSGSHRAIINIICESPEKSKNLDVSGVIAIGDDTFVVTSEDKVKINFNEDLNCAVYLSSLDSRIKNEILTMEKMNIESTKSLTITKNPSQPKMQIASLLTDDKLTSQSSTYMKLTINNTGNKEVIIKDINLNVNSQFLTCASMDLKPGESTECIFSVSPKDSSLLKADMKYQYMMCGERQTKTESYPAGFIDVKPAECLKNEDCQTGYVCCSGLCHDSAKGICSDVNADGVNEWTPIS
jgi:hypothetical protein